MHLTDWLVELQGHKRRVAYIEWHPSAENILFSAGFDHLVIIWDIEKGETANVIDCHPDVIYSMSLNRDGSLLATTCKDKKLRVIEPRSGIVKSVINLKNLEKFVLRRLIPGGGLSLGLQSQ